MAGRTINRKGKSSSRVSVGSKTPGGGSVTAETTNASWRSDRSRPNFIDFASPRKNIGIHQKYTMWKNLSCRNLKEQNASRRGGGNFNSTYTQQFSIFGNEEHTIRFPQSRIGQRKNIGCMRRDFSSQLSSLPGPKSFDQRDHIEQKFSRDGRKKLAPSRMRNTSEMFHTENHGTKVHANNHPSYVKRVSLDKSSSLGIIPRRRNPMDVKLRETSYDFLYTDERK